MPFDSPDRWRGLSKVASPETSPPQVEMPETALEPGESYTVVTKGEVITNAGEIEAVVTSSVI